MDMNGKRAIVLGGTSGIGLATVRQLAQAGARAIGAGRSQANIDAAAEAVPAASFRQVDALDRDALSALFASLAPFDALVCAATGGERASGPFLSMSLDGFQGSFRKLWGYANAVRLGAEHLAETGAIVLVSGYPARRCNPGAIALSAVGNAVEGFARGLAPELAPRRINVVSPGIIDTPLFPAQGAAREQFLTQATRDHPIPRAGRAEEVAAAICFAIGNNFMTGATLDVDGGAPLP